jgi:hypothetical protein
MHRISNFILEEIEQTRLDGQLIIECLSEPRHNFVIMARKVRDESHQYTLIVEFVADEKSNVRYYPESGNNNNELIISKTGYIKKDAFFYKDGERKFVSEYIVSFQGLKYGLRW